MMNINNEIYFKICGRVSENLKKIIIATVQGGKSFSDAIPEVVRKHLNHSIELETAKYPDNEIKVKFLSKSIVRAIIEGFQKNITLEKNSMELIKIVDTMFGGVDDETSRNPTTPRKIMANVTLAKTVYDSKTGEAILDRGRKGKNKEIEIKGACPTDRSFYVVPYINENGKFNKRLLKAGCKPKP
jgi:hypothetical protein